MPVQIRPYRRDDRDQLTQLVNAHVQAVVPGITVSTHRILRQLECEPGEFIVDPWVVARHTLVAEHRGRVTAAVHLLGYGDGAEVGDQYRGRGELRWLVCWPDAPYWPDATADGLMLGRAALGHPTHRTEPGRRGRLHRPGVRSTDLGLLAGGPGWADVGNLWVDPDLRRRGVGRWLVGQASAWLRLGHVDRLLHYVAADDHDELAFACAVGFRVLSTTTREFLAS